MKEITIQKQLHVNGGALQSATCKTCGIKESWGRFKTKGMMSWFHKLDYGHSFK